MQGARQQIILEFFEKLFATLALGIGSMLSPVALFPLFGRRVAWRQRTPHAEQAQTLATREVGLFLAMALGLMLLRPLLTVPFDRTIVTLFCLILSFGAMLLGERSSAALLPALSSRNWTGPRLRNLLGWVLLALSIGAFSRSIPPELHLPCALVAMLFSILPLTVAGVKGEPGLLIPGTAIYLAGAVFSQPLVAAAGLGLTAPTAVLITHNLKASFALRGLLCALAAWCGLYAPSIAATGAAAVVFGLSLGMWPLTLRLCMMTFLCTFYRFRIYGRQNYASDGPGLLLSNHVTMVDGFLLGAFTQRMVRFLVYDAFYKNPVSRVFLHLFRTVSISQGARRDVVESLRKARAGIEEGHFAGIFPEGGITRSGHLHPFQKGFTRLVSGTQIPVIPAYMNGLWCTLLSFSERKVNLRIPRLFRTVEIEYGEPLPSTLTAVQVWRVVKHLEVNAAFRDSDRAPILPLAFLAAARRYDRKPAVIANGKATSYGDLASNALLFARHINRRIRRKKRFGVYLPEGVEKVIAHVSIALAGHVAMDIPAFDKTEFDEYAHQHGLAAIVTSQAWIQAHGVAKTDSMFFIGRTLERFDSRERTRTRIYRMLSSRRAWRQVCTLAMRRESAVAIVTSPRGPAVLSQRGIESVTEAARRVLWWQPGVTIRNRTPLNRAVGVTIGLWMPLLHGATLTLDDTAVDFEIVPAENCAEAHADSKHVIVVEDENCVASEAAAMALGDRYLPMLEVAEAGGPIAISSPTVDFQGEVQHGSKLGTWGKLPFGLEIEETDRGIRLRGPGRLLRFLDQENKEAQARAQTRVDDWLDLDLPVRLTAEGFIERRPISEPHTSSTPPDRQMSLDPQGE